VLTHANFMTECDNLIAGWRPVFDPVDGEQPSTLLFLPLAHVFGRMVQVAALRAGVRLGHQPDMSAAALLPDLAAFRPTFVLGVPYVFERVFGAARAKAEREGNLGIFERAVEVAVRFAEARERRAFGEGPGPGPALRLSHRFYDRLVYAKVREALGGRVRNAVSGGSTMGRRLSLFFDGAGVTVYEGYGLTESTSAAACNPPGRVRHGTVGRPVPGTAIRITQDHEILLRGGNVFAGYLDDPVGTAEALRDGWLHTGDLGSLDEDGYLTITGRKKELIVTASGKNLTPGVLEERVREHPLVEHCVVLGNGRPYIAALVTLDPDAVAHWLRLRGRPDLPDPGGLVGDPDLEAEVRRAVSAANTQVSKAESIRVYRILPFSFTEERGLLTPSRKLKRRAIEQACSPEIEALYGR
jgi:long-chain acyl-CoA synthetase